MNIDETIERLIAAMDNLARAIDQQSLGLLDPAQVPAAAAPAEKAAPAASGKGKGGKDKAAAPAAGPAEEAKAAVAQAKAIDFQVEIAPLFVRLINEQGQEAGRAIIDHFDASKNRISQAVSPEQYPELLEMLRKALAAPSDSGVGV